MLRDSVVKYVLLVTVSMAAGALLTLTMLQPQYINFNSSREMLTLDDLAGEVTPVSRLRTHNHHPDKIVALQETQKVRVLCWVLAHPAAHYTKAVHVKATWGARCDKLIFISSKNDTKLGAVDIGVGEGRHKLWAKTRAAFTYVYKNYLSEYDWFYKADDNTYAIMENLHYMLSFYDPNFPIYFGSKYKNGYYRYMSGGAGYVLSREAVKKFVEEALPNRTICFQGDTGGEDVMMGACLQNVGVMAGDSRDSSGRGRFFHISFTNYLFNELPGWYTSVIYYKPDTGFNFSSESAISFHYIEPRKMYEMEYLLYHLRPQGVSSSHPFPLPLPPDRDCIPPQLLKERGMTSTSTTDSRKNTSSKNRH
ncbi:glycoprotein-N-acetylgalactosamine 3-beta-galactosyltransferase 1-like [Procambarus clarkii]|uniref:glycoprotein-N-acetylgalactosamine 3-beta-galactosyltransferase 1-like n=1 Tax=Procambarus clarkii TaxID=6728 RepID=UPI003743246D